MDPKVLNKERLQNADESYEGDMCESEDDSNSNNGDINEPLAFVFERGIYIFINIFLANYNWTVCTEIKK